MTTPATESKRKRTSEGHPDGPSKTGKIVAPNFSQPTEMVTFLVGEDEEPFKVHKEFACHYSPVLKAAFNSNFLEGQTQTYRLNDMRPSAFRLLAKWFYSERLDTRVDHAVSPDSVPDSTEDKTNPDRVDDGFIRTDTEANEAQDMDYAQLWVAGDRLLMPGLQNAVILAWQKLWCNKSDDRECTISWFDYAYEHTCEESPLRNVAVDQLAYSIDAKKIKERKDEIPRELLIDLALVHAESVFPITRYDDGFQEAWTVEYSEKAPGSIAIDKFRYQCTRAWRSYLVPEEV